MRMLTKTERYLPYENKIENAEFGIECSYQCDNENKQYYAILFAGKSNKKIFHYRFRSESDMMQRINNSIENIIANETSKRDKKAKQKELQANLKASDHFKIGDIVVNTWGCEQTNVEFYQVVEVKNKQIVIHEIAQQYVEGSMISHGMACDVMPIKDSFLEDEKDFTIGVKMDFWNGKEQVTLCNPKNFYYFHVWDGRPQYKSWYA